MRHWIVVLGLSWACGGSEQQIAEVAEVTDTGADDPSAYIYEVEEVVPILALDEVEQGITDALVSVFTLDPLFLHQAYDEMVALSDDDCPYYYDYYYEDYDRYYWYDACTTDEGDAFSGYAIHSDWSGYEADGYTYDEYRYLSAQAKITHADGRVIEAAGYSSYYERTYPDYATAAYHYIVGDFRFDGPSAEGTWLAKDWSAYLYFYGAYYPGYPGNYVTTYGSLSGLDGLVNAIELDDVVLYQEALGSPCGIEPSGTISVRDDDGAWYDVDFQGPAYWGAPAFPPECDGCGEVYYRGTYQGEVCPEFSPLVDWQERPW
ncbi:MAG: hypothetical protein QGG40_20555 [Myxococcota bacterium]|nr:hypothetical protein [Myxococcota bacterium]